MPYVETFTTGAVEEETGTDTGPATDVVIVRVEDAAGLTALQWLSSGRVGTAVGQPFPHQPVETVHKPNPTSLTVRSVFL